MTGTRAKMSKGAASREKRRRAKTREVGVAWQASGGFHGIDSTGRALPLDGDGGAGTKPADLLPMALISCTAVDVVEILRKQRQDLRSLEATATAEQDPDPPWRFRRITVRFTARGDVDPRKAEAALRLSEQKYCSIANTLRPAVALSCAIEVVRDE